jgi:hypothetical protein
VIPVLVDNPAVGHADTGVGVADTGVANAGTGGGQTTTGGTGGGHTATGGGQTVTGGTGGGHTATGGTGGGHTATGGGHTATRGGHAATASRALGPPPASVDFVSQVWNNFGATVLPLCGGVAQEAVRTNRDPLEIGEHDSVLIQKDIISSTIRKYGILYHTLFDLLKGTSHRYVFFKICTKMFFPLV